MRWNSHPDLLDNVQVVGAFAPLFMRQAQERSARIMRSLRRSDERLAEEAVAKIEARKALEVREP